MSVSENIKGIIFSNYTLKIILITVAITLIILSAVLDLDTLFTVVYPAMGTTIAILSIIVIAAHVRS